VLREVALASLGELGGQAELPRLIERARRDESEVVRKRAEALSGAANALRTA